MARIFSKMSFSAILVFVILASRPALASLEGERITHLFEKQADSVVLIAVSQKNHQENKLGSGFVVSEDGLIVTNAHLVSQADQIVVKLRNNRAYRNVRIIGADAEKDIALLKVNAQGLKAVKLGNSKKVEIGQRVVTIGNPLGLESTVSDGLISSVREGEPGFKIFQTSVPLSQGSSGGPLFDLKGKVVGITTASLLKGQNLNFAIPINYVKPLLRRDILIKNQPGGISPVPQLLWPGRKVLRQNFIRSKPETPCTGSPRSSSKALNNCKIGTA